MFKFGESKCSSERQLTVRLLYSEKKALYRRALIYFTIYASPRGQVVLLFGRFLLSHTVAATL